MTSQDRRGDSPAHRAPSAVHAASAPVYRWSYALIPLTVCVFYLPLLFSSDLQSGTLTALAEFLVSIAAIALWYRTMPLPNRWAISAILFLTAFTGLSLFNTGLRAHALFGDVMEWGTVASLALFLGAFSLGAVSSRGSKTAVLWGVELAGAVGVIPVALALLGLIPLSVLQAVWMPLSFVSCGAAFVAAVRADGPDRGEGSVHAVLGILSLAVFCAFFSVTAASVALLVAFVVLVLRGLRALRVYALAMFVAVLFIALLAGIRSPALPLVGDGHPGLQTTDMVIGPLYTANLKSSLIGNGPHTFQYVWNRYRPASENESPFWMYTPKYPASAVATIAIEYGLFAMLGFVALLYFAVDHLRHFASRAGGSVALSAAALFFLVSSFVFPLGVPLLALSGVLIGMCTRESAACEGRRAHLGAGAFWIALIAVMAVLSVVSVRQIAASVYDFRGLAALSAGDETAAVPLLDRAVRLWSASAYQDDAALAFMRKGAAEIASNSVEQGKNHIIEAAGFAEEAAATDSEDFNRWMFSASFFTELTQRGADGARAKAETALAQAAALAPNRPDVYVAQAKLSLLKNDRAGAATALERALELKPDYAAARQLLSSLAAQ